MDDREYRRALRAIARRHHPDLDGDHEAYLAAVAALDRRRRLSRAARAARESVHVQPAPWWRRVARRARRRARAWRRDRQDARRRQRNAQAARRT